MLLAQLFRDSGEEHGAHDGPPDSQDVRFGAFQCLHTVKPCFLGKAALAINLFASSSGCSRSTSSSISSSNMIQGNSIVSGKKRRSSIVVVVVLVVVVVVVVDVEP